MIETSLGGSWTSHWRLKAQKKKVTIESWLIPLGLYEGFGYCILQEGDK